MINGVVSGIVSGVVSGVAVSVVSLNVSDCDWQQVPSKDTS